jgi:hypothetical protein
MKPCDRVTIIRNRVRARDLRLFRSRVQDYFEQLESETDNLPVDWDRVRDTRAAINRMLPRIVQVVQAADLGGPHAARHGLLHEIFSARFSQGAHQEILDVIDMAIGAYDSSWYAALVRTLNPFHYVLSALGYVAGLPRRALVAFGLLSPRAPAIRPGQAGRLDDAVSRLAGMEELLESRFADLREWQSRRLSENADLLTELAERMDFLERVLAQQRPVPQLKPGAKKGVTPD